jgi:uncharacterized membrane protein
LGSLSQAKMLGGIGSILAILTAVPQVGWIIGIVGFILVFIAIKYISDAVGDKSIFDNYLIAFVLIIIGLVIGGVTLLVSIFSIFDIPSLIAGGSPPTFEDPASIFQIIQAVLIPLLLVWVFGVVSAIFLRKSFNSVASSLNIGLFSTAALINLIGSVLTVVLIGFIIIFIADIIQIIAFFLIPEQTPQPQQQPS